MRARPNVQRPQDVFERPRPGYADRRPVQLRRSKGRVEHPFHRGESCPYASAPCSRHGRRRRVPVSCRVITERRVRRATARHSRTAASHASCPWLNQSEPISTRVSQLMAKMTLPTRSTSSRVTARATLRLLRARDPAPVHPAARRGGRPRRGRRRAHRRHPAARRRRPGGDLLPALARQLRRRDRQRGVGQGRRGQPRPDDQPRPRPALGPVVRGVQRGSVS